jgi:hypothetical protein
MPIRSSVGLVHEQNFIVATRDTGYRSTASAVAELVDNAIQAQASSISILVSDHGVGVQRELTLACLDNGTGMTATTLRTALRFGGSTRFDDRSGQGRFGMGLPNSSVSQARRLDVYTWQRNGRTQHCYIDVDEISAGELRSVPPVSRRAPPEQYRRTLGKSGTLVFWSKCDRFDGRKVSTIVERLKSELGRQFRHFLKAGVRIDVNSEPVAIVDPLLVDVAPVNARLFGEPLIYELRVPTKPTRTSKVEVRFSELPVETLYHLSDVQKHELGITRHAGVSVVRAGREIDRGWLFMGTKRRENYDDWWRCEIRFDPELDEAFGVNHSKQQITPTRELKELLSPDMETVAHSLNARVRAAYSKARVANSDVARAATTRAAGAEDRLLQSLQRNRPELGGSPENSGRAASIPMYRVTCESLRTSDFFVWSTARDGRLQITINTNHPFYDRVFEPAMANRLSDDGFSVQCMVLALVRTLAAEDAKRSKSSSTLISEWSQTMSTFLGN